jgi:hypothetical protein
MTRLGHANQPPANEALKQTAAAILVPRDIKAHSAAAAAELFRSAAVRPTSRSGTRDARGLRPGQHCLYQILCVFFGLAPSVCSKAADVQP